MTRLSLAVMCSLMLLTAGDWLMGQDKTPPEKDAQTSMPTKTKGTLPTHFKKLGLTDEQTKKVLTIHGSYKAKIDALSQQIADLKKEERAELDKVLSDTQRIRLRELRTGESETSKDKMPSKEKEEK